MIKLSNGKNVSVKKLTLSELQIFQNEELTRPSGYSVHFALMLDEQIRSYEDFIRDLDDIKINKFN